MSEAQAAAPATEAADSNPAEETNTENQEVQAATADADSRTNAEIDADKSLSKEEKKEEKRLNKLRLKFNGKEYDEELPFEIPDTEEARNYMSKNLQMSKLANTKSQEAAQWQKDAFEFLEALKSNPRAVLSDPTIGLDLKKLAVEIIEEEIENSKKSPEQLKAEQLEKELKDLKDQRKKEDEERKSREFERLQEENFERYETMIERALEKSDLPKSPYTVKKMADYMLLGLEKGLDVTPEDVLSLVRDEMHNDLKLMFAAMPAEVIEQIVGKENINKVRKNNLSKAKSATKAPTPVKEAIKDVGQKSVKEEKPAEKKNFKQFFGI